MKWNTLLLTFALVALLVPCGFGQGLILDEEAYGQVPVQSDYGDGSKSEMDAVQKIRKVSLKPYCPEVKSQGAISSCVGWAAGYAAYSIQQAILNEWRGLRDVTTENAFSAMFLYNQIKIYDCENGARISDALELMRDSGNVFHKDFDMEIDNCYRKPDSILMVKAKKHKIKRFEALFRSNASSEVKKNKTKLSLIQNKPVIAGFELLNGFQQLRATDEFWYPEIGDQGLFGGHAMVVVGFDDEKQAFEIMNSWGSGWGNKGFIWVPYDDYARYCRHAYQMSISEEELIRDKIFTAEAQLRRPVMKTKDGVVYNYPEVILKKNIYQFRQPAQSGKDRFQLLLENVNNSMYAYAFSLTSDNRLKIHWPRDGEIDEKFEGLNESAIITVPEVKLILPTPHKALLFKKGKEYLILLFSLEPLDDINQKIENLVRGVGDIPSRLQEVFGKDLVPFNQLNYNPLKMAFRNGINSGSIIPIIFEMEVQ